jgi:hypothetical protein
MRPEVGITLMAAYLWCFSIDSSQNVEGKVTHLLLPFRIPYV